MRVFQQAPRALLGFVLLFAAVDCATPAQRDKRPTIARPSSHEWINPLLGLEHAQWLVGARAWMATPEEVEEFMSLSDDAEAERFEREFWRRRDANASALFGGVEQTFDERSDEADDRFEEGARPGRKTDRGAIYILYGEPTDIEFETSAEPDEPTLEVWSYRGQDEPGLDGRRPPRRLFFEQAEDGRTRLTTGGQRRSRIRAVR